MKNSHENPILDYFIPRYTAGTIYLMALSFALLFGTNGDLRSQMASVFDYHPVGAILMYLIVGLFWLAAITCPLTLGELHKSDKRSLLIFALLINGYAGVTGGWHSMMNSEGILILFPIWNIFNCLFLLLLAKLKIVDEGNFVDTPIAGRQIVVGTIALLILFYLCQFRWKFHWGITFSICVSYASAASAMIQHIFPAPPSKFVAIAEQKAELAKQQQKIRPRLKL